MLSLRFSVSPFLRFSAVQIPAALAISIPLCCLLFLTGCSKQAKKERHLSRAEQYLKAKSFQKAEIEYLNALRLDPENPRVVSQLATIYFDQGNIARSIPFLLRAQELDNTNAGVRTRLGQIYLFSSQPDKARDQAIQVLQRNPTNDDALLLLADSALKSSDFADAFKRLSELQPRVEHRAAWHLAIATLHLRHTNYPAVTAALEKAMTLEPESSRVHFAWANYFWSQNELKKADEAFQKAADLNPADAHRRLRWVEFKIKTGSAADAKILLQQITTSMPEFTPAWTYLGRISFDEQNYQECSNVVRRVLARDPSNFEVRLLSARLKRVQGRPADAIKELETLRRVYPRSGEVPFQLALAHLRNQDVSKAINSLQEALAIDPNLTQANLLLAELNIQKGETGAAINSLQSIVSNNPDAGRAQLLLGSAYSSQGRFEDALSVYAAMEKKFPTNATISFLAGLTLRQQNRTAEARKAFEKAIELAPGDIIVTYQLVDLDLREKQFSAASNRVEALLAKIPRSAPAKFLQARIFLAQTNLAAAESALEQAIDWEPNFTSAYNLIVQIFVVSNKLPQAIGKLEQMLKLNPKNIRALMQMAVIHNHLGQIDKAEETYRHLLKISPDFMPALNNLAYLLYDKPGKFDEAYVFANKARQLAPNDPAIADTLGWICFNRREYSRSLALIQESALRLADDAEVQFHLGMALYMMADTEAARLAFNRSLELGLKTGRNEAERRLALLNLDSAKADAKTISFLEERIRQDPADLPALHRLGGSYVRTGALDKALTTYEVARKVNPHSVPVLLDLARLHVTGLNQPQQALVLAREARKLSPANPKIAHLLGKLAMDTSDHSWACSLLQESAQKQPNDGEVLFDLAEAYFSLGRLPEAEQTVQLALQSSSEFARRKDAQSLLDLIVLVKSPQQAVTAEPKVQRLLKDKPDYVPALMVAGIIHHQLGRTSEASRCYETVVGRAPQCAPARKYLAALFTDNVGDHQKAWEHARKARDTMSDDPELAQILGRISYRRADYRAATRFLEEARLKRPDNAEHLYLLGMAHYHLKDLAQTRQHLDRALALSPNAPFAVEARKVLAELQKS